MKKFHQGSKSKSVNRTYSNEKLKEACFKFNIKSEEANLIRSNKNLIYDCGDKVLRISPSIIRSKSEVEAEINWLIFLIEKELPVVRLIPSNTKKYFEVIDGQDNYETVVCFEKIIGNKISKPYWNGEHFKKLGKLVGNLHRVGKQFKPKETLEYQDWDSIIEYKYHKYLPQDNRELPKLHQNLVKQINQISKTKENYGLVHYDIHHGNYLLNQEDGKLKLFDFEMTCNSWFINDISTVLYYANHFPKTNTGEEFETYFMSLFWEGYRQEYRIDKSEIEWIPKFLLFRDLMIYGFLSKIWNDKEMTKPELSYFEMIEHSIKVRRNKLGV